VSAAQHVLFDTNLFVFLLFDISEFDKARERDRVLACASRVLMDSIFKREDCVILVAEVEIPRAVARMVIVRGLVSEDKVAIVVSGLRKAGGRLKEWEELGLIKVADSWTAKVLRGARWLYQRLSKRDSSLAKRIRHQDFMLVATVMLHGATIVTADKHVKEIVERCEVDTPIYYVEVEETLEVHTPVHKRVPCIDEALEQLHRCREFARGWPLSSGEVIVKGYPREGLRTLRLTRSYATFSLTSPGLAPTC